MYLSSVTAAVRMSPAAAVTGSAKLRNQCPPVAQFIYSRYSAVIAKSIGMKITGFG